jgi:hypothetical protein
MSTFPQGKLDLLPLEHSAEGTVARNLACYTSRPVRPLKARSILLRRVRRRIASQLTSASIETEPLSAR